MSNVFLQQGIEQFWMHKRQKSVLKSLLTNLFFKLALTDFFGHFEKVQQAVVAKLLALYHSLIQLY